MSEEHAQRKKHELHAFIFLTLVLAPLITVIIVGGYGSLIWLFQLFMGPPAG